MNEVCFENLKDLVSLNVCHNKLNKLPESLKKLKYLDSLYIGGCNLSVIPQL